MEWHDLIDLCLLPIWLLCGKWIVRRQEWNTAIPAISFLGLCISVVNVGEQRHNGDFDQGGDHGGDGMID